MVFVAVSVSVALLGLTRIPFAYAHAEVTSPAIRTVPGPGFLETCGQSSFDAVTNDATGHIEEQEPINQNAGCELTMCRGMLFSDQPASNVQTVKPNQAMEMSIDCTIPHGGPANVSLIDTTGGGAGEFIGSFLKTFDDFCPTSGETPADQTNLQFNLPSAGDIGSRCQNAGDCVVQLFWATPDFTQNYYYCVDVVMDAASAKDESEAAVPSFAESDDAEVATEDEDVGADDVVSESDEGVSTGITADDEEVSTDDEVVSTDDEGPADGESNAAPFIDNAVETSGESFASRSVKAATVKSRDPVSAKRTFNSRRPSTGWMRANLWT